LDAHKNGTNSNLKFQNVSMNNKLNFKTDTRKFNNLEFDSKTAAKANINLDRMSNSAKRTLTEENRGFQDQWTHEFGFIEENGKARCLVCKETISTLKRFNLKRHYQRHGDLQNLEGESRKEKILHFKSVFMTEKNSKASSSADNKAIVKASYKISQLIAKNMKPYNEGEFIKECLEQTADVLCPEKKSLFGKISLSPQTMARRIHEIALNIEETLKSRCQHFRFYSIALDESTDATDTAQVAHFIRGVDENVNITE